MNMNDNTRKSDDSHIRKYGTGIDGLDRLLYGGIDLQSPLTVITVEGDDEVERSTLGLQILYGLSQSIYASLTSDAQKKALKVHHISSFSDSNRAEVLLMNVIISTNIRQLMEMYVSAPVEERDKITNVMSRIFFDIDNLEKNNSAYDEIANNRLINMVQERTDYLLGKEVLYYSNRTGCIHLRSARGCQDLDADSDEENRLLERRTLQEIVDEFENGKAEIEESKEFKQYNEVFKKPFVKIVFDEIKEDDLIENMLSNMDDNFLLAVDLRKCDNSQISKFVGVINKSKSQKNVRVLLLILPKTGNSEISDDLTDMRIEMMDDWDKTYQYKYLTIAKSRRQNRVMGLHQYKRKDYGIEVYPSVHTYYEQRRYLQRAMVFTHSDVLTDTYQQYIDIKSNCQNEKIGYKDYIDNKKEQSQKVLSALYPKYDYGMSSVDVLDRILLPQFNSHNVTRNVLDASLCYLGCVTAIIGDPNSYKRFLTFGSIFSSSLNKEHTLVLLMNKDYMTARRQLSCPARAEHAENDEKCMKCYQYIHFMNMSMGNITPAEFIYYLKRQLDTCYMDGHTIKRIVLDDLQMVDFCFSELSKQDSMFLPTMISLCREKGIWLYILCDKVCNTVNALRALSDNVICTERGKDGQLMVHIERYAGYHNAPSMIRSCHVKKVKHLFDCYEKMDDDDNTKTFFEFNNQQIVSKSEPTLSQYWNRNK